MSNFNQLNNLQMNTIFNALNNRDLARLAMTSKDMMKRVQNYLKRTGRSVPILKLNFERLQKRKNEKNWKKRPRNNNNSSSSGSATRRLVF
jgi:hypothetical protein